MQVISFLMDWLCEFVSVLISILDALPSPRGGSMTTGSLSGEGFLDFM